MLKKIRKRGILQKQQKSMDTKMVYQNWELKTEMLWKIYQSSGTEIMASLSCQALVEEQEDVLKM